MISGVSADIELIVPLSEGILPASIDSKYGIMASTVGLFVHLIVLLSLEGIVKLLTLHECPTLQTS
jgi:hypothetical protein